MSVSVDKSANQLYREYKKNGGTLVFKQWLDREKKKNFIGADGTSTTPVNKPLNAGIQSVIASMSIAAGNKLDLENKYIFGVHRTLWISIGVAVVIGGAWLIYHNRKNK